MAKSLTCMANKSWLADSEGVGATPKGKKDCVHTTSHEVETAQVAFENAGREIPDMELVPLVKKGVPWASDCLIRRHYAKARAFVFRLCGGNSADTEDITQQAFLNALKHIRSFEEKASFKTWFYRILVNTCLDARRRRRRWLGFFSSPLARRKDGDTVALSPDDFPDQGEDSDPSTSFRNQALRADIQKALGILPEKQQLVFQLKVLEDLSISEIAGILEMAPGTVKSHLFRATRIMREVLAGWAGR
jgi:RNA polymerase sigma-70 factor (ECF subfamily)